MKNRLLHEQPPKRPAASSGKNLKTEGWDAAVRKDHQMLRIQADVLDSVLGIDVAERDRRVVLSWTLRNLWPELELHLRKEEQVLFPPMERLMGLDAGALTILRGEHADLRASFRRMAELLQDPDHLEWDRIELAVDGFLYLLEEHEKIGSRLILDVLGHNLNQEHLVSLSKEYRAVAEKAHAEEGWPAPRWGLPY